MDGGTAAPDGGVGSVGNRSVGEQPQRYRFKGGEMARRGYRIRSLGDWLGSRWLWLQLTANLHRFTFARWAGAGMGKSIWEAYMPKQNPLNLRGIPTHRCICGCELFVMIASFEDCEVSLYFTDAQCLDCGALVTLPTPVDNEENTLL